MRNVYKVKLKGGLLMSNAFSTVTEEQAKEIIRNADNLDNKSKYLILIDAEYVSNEGETYRTYEIVVGRRAAYDYIKMMLQSEEEMGISINTRSSRILVEPEIITENTPRITLSNMLDIYTLMTDMVRTGKIVDDDSSFDMEDYYMEPLSEDD